MRKPTVATTPVLDKRSAYRVLSVLVLLASFALRVWRLDEIPPGLHFDEAVYGLLANDILGGARPVFFSAYTGREVLYMYLMAAVFAATGPVAFGIRLTSAFVGTATVAVTYRLAGRLYGRSVGLVSAALIAVSYWHLTVSRNGYPNVLIAPIIGLSAFYLWRGWQIGRMRDWALGGSLTGLVLHTYLAARFWPVFVAAACLYALLVDRQTWRRRVSGMALAGVFAAIVFAPLALHFVAHPADFTERANQVLAWREQDGAQLLATYSSNARRTIAGLSSTGDPRWHFNIPGRPMLTPAVGLLFVAGVLVCLRNWRDLAHAMLLLWIAVMSLPGILTLEMQPAGQRIFGVLPALLMIPAVGLVATAGAISRLSGPRLPRAAIAAGLALVVVGASAVTAARDYFLDWAKRPETYHIFNADYAAIAARAADDIAAGREVVLLTEHYKHATIVFLAPVTAEQAIWCDPTLALPIAREAADELVYYRLCSYLDDESAAAKWLDEHASERTELPAAVAGQGAEGQQLGAVRYRVPTPELRSATGTEMRLGEVEVVRTAGELEVARGEQAVVAIDWRVADRPDEGRGFALHIRDTAGITWAQTDATGYLADQWRPGDVVRQWFRIHMDPEMPPGRYTAMLLVVREGGGPMPGELDGRQVVELPIARIQVTSGGAVSCLTGDESRTKVGKGLFLVGADPAAADRGPGGEFEVSLRWSSTERGVAADDVEFVLRSEASSLSLGMFSIAGEHGPDTWQPGEIVRGRYRLHVPAEAESGEYVLAVRPSDSDGATEIGHLTVSGERIFAAPDMGHKLDVRFGERLVLAGYSATEEGLAGESAAVALFWHRLEGELDEAPGALRDAKVFVHVLNGDGRVVAQHDSRPAAGARPISGWLAGEYVADLHEVALPPEMEAGEYRYVVGLYDAATGERWPISGQAASANDSLTLPVPIRIERDG